MTVLYFADTRFPIERANGVQTMATCHALAERGHDVTLVVRPDTTTPPRDPSAFYGLPPQERLTLTYIPASGGAHARRVRFLLGAARMATARKAIVYTRDLGLAAFLVQFPRARRPRVVYESHGIAAVVREELPQLLGNPSLVASAAKLRRLDRRDGRVWRRAAAYVTITRALADDLAERFGPRERVFVAPDGAYLRESAPLPSSDMARPDRFVAGYAGHLYPWKGVDVLVRALALVPGVRGLIVGGHPGERDLERVERLARETGVVDRVTFSGPVAPRAVAQMLEPASALIIPNTASSTSDRYTSPLKLFEYLTLGRPIVASDLPSLREVLTDGQTALLVPPGDPAALASALRRLAAEPDLASRLAANARAIAPSFSWHARAARVEAALLAAP